MQTDRLSYVTVKEEVMLIALVGFELSGRKIREDNPLIRKLKCKMDCML